MSDVADQPSVGYWVRRRRELQVAATALDTTLDLQAPIGDEEAA